MIRSSFFFQAEDGIRDKLVTGVQTCALPISNREASPLVAAVMKTKIRVVLADDHPVVRDGLAAMVNQQADMEVVAEAGDGDEAIALYEQHRPDVMVLDLRMPKRDGVSVVQRVLELHPKACILIMTTYDGDEDIFQCLSQCAKGC